MNTAADTIGKRCRGCGASVPLRPTKKSNWICRPCHCAEQRKWRLAHGRVVRQEEPSAPGEVWRPVLGIQGSYEVSNQGRVRNWERKLLRGSVERKYHRVCLRRGSERVYRTVHGLVAEAFLGARPAGAQVRHLNGKHADNRVQNLAWGTPLENAADRILHGTQARGEAAGAAKLTEEIVRSIRKRHASGTPERALAKDHGVTTKAIQAIVQRRTWSHVDEA